MKKIRELIAILLLLLARGSLVFSETPFAGIGDSDLTLGFAASLLAEGDRKGAILEYRRYLFGNAAPDFSAVAGLEAAYYGEKDYAAVASVYAEYGSSIDDQKTAEAVNLLYASALLDGDYEPEFASFMAGGGIVGSGLSGPSFDSLRIASAVSGKKYEAASALAARYPDDERMAALQKSIGEYRPKSAPLALALSAVVPGLGRAYARQLPDGLVSFLTTGVLACFSAYAFSRDGIDAVRPWVYGGASALMYSVNLYGSYQAALRFNEAQERGIANEARAVRERYAP